MLFQVYTENGVKKIKPLTADTGTGAPVGSYLMLEKKSNPQGYLYCDGSTFDSTAYPALYQYLGTNVLPDFREFSPVGAEQNTTNVYDASTNPSGVIHDHDVYTEGESKDDQLQVHLHAIPCDNVGGGSNDNASVRGSSLISGSVLGYLNDNPSLSGNGRVGTVTRGKRKAVFVYIKATSGLTENQQENVLNTINDNLSYSTTEHKTGKKWIDGKPTYEKTVNCGMLPNATGKTVAHNIANIGDIVKISGITIRVGATLPLPYVTGIDSLGNNYSVNLYVEPTNVVITTYMDMTDYYATYVTLEYTKTTD